MLGAARLFFALSVFLGGCSDTWKLEDGDGDGVTAQEGDCWDAAEGPEGTGLSGEQIGPNATETWYDGFDQDCAGDDDYDQDGDGVVSTASTGGEPDCDDTDPSVYPDAEDGWYDGIDSDCGGEDDYDQDADGYQSADYGGEDCDDLDALVTPVAEEIWYDGVDQDCAGDDDYDQDADGFVVTNDCDDTDPAKFPDYTIPEVWYDGVDDNCDGNDGDQDEDGYVSDDYAAEFPNWEDFNAHLGAGDCWDDPNLTPTDMSPINGFPDLTADEVSPIAEETWYDAVDQDCAGDDDFDQDADGQATAFYPTRDLVYGTDCIDGSDLDDANPAGLDPADVYYGHAETWYDGTDQDCAGNPSDFDQDGDGFDSDSYTYGTADDCDDTLDDVNPDGTEVCATDYDDDCDGDVNDPGVPDGTLYYPDDDGDDYGDEDDDGELLCSGTSAFPVTDNTDCNDAAAGVSPADAEICDSANTDEDCDDKADDLDSSVASSGKTTWYKDVDEDTYGDADTTTSKCDLPAGYVSNDDDCDDSDEDINPDATEVCDSADTDEDCDGDADDDDSDVASSGKTTYYLDADSDGYGKASSTTKTCDLPTGYAANDDDCDDTSAAISPADAEICDSADTDEDCDGKADDDDSGVSSSGKTTWYLDADDDGYGKSSSTKSACDLPDGYAAASTDCDDTDEDINPAATEICDSSDTDEDCDGDADDDDSSVSSSTKTTYYRDADSDGYGLSTSTKAYCDLTSGYVANSTDCNDSSSSINPAATETTGDGVDYNCDGKETCYANADGDSYRTTSTVSSTDTDCTDSGEALSSVTSGDCDDANSAISPGATEICDGSDTDEDCDEKADDEDTSVSSSGKTTYYLDSDGDGYGLSSSTKTFCDEAVGYSTESTDCDDGDDTRFPTADEVCEDGVVNDCDGTEAEAQDACMGTSFGVASSFARRYGEAASDLTGSSLSFVGDVDGDGSDEVLLGGPAVSSSKGRAFLLAGPMATGLKKLTDANSTARITGLAVSDALGTAVAGAGDITGDGYDDLLLGAPGVDKTGSIKEIGAAYLVYGPVTDSVNVDDVADGTASGGAASDNAGISVAGVGDVTGDGKGDLLIGADGEDTVASAAGAAYLLAGPPGTITLTSATATAFFTGEAAGDAAGNQVAAGGDLDGDGTPDLLIGAYAANPSSKADAGKAYVILGPATGTLALSAADVILSGVTASDYAGCALGGGQDVDGDGYDDFVVGAKGLDTGGSGAGGAYLIYGDTTLSSAITLSSAGSVIAGDTAGDAAGTSVALAPDINHDGMAEVIIGAPTAEGASSDTDRGAAYLLYGPPAATVDLGSADVTINGYAAGDKAGSAVAGGGDHDADGYGDLLVGAPYQDSGGTSDVGYSYLIEGTSY